MQDPQDPDREQGWDPMSEGGDDPEDVDVEQNREEAADEDAAPPL